MKKGGKTWQETDKEGLLEERFEAVCTTAHRKQKQC